MALRLTRDDFILCQCIAGQGDFFQIKFLSFDHFFNVFHDNGTGMKSIFDFFIVFFKNLLEDIHKSIMKE